MIRKDKQREWRRVEFETLLFRKKRERESSARELNGADLLYFDSGRRFGGVYLVREIFAG